MFKRDFNKVLGRILLSTLDKKVTGKIVLVYEIKFGEDEIQFCVLVENTEGGTNCYIFTQEENTSKKIDWLINNRISDALNSNVPSIRDRALQIKSCR